MGSEGDQCDIESETVEGEGVEGEPEEEVVEVRNQSGEDAFMVMKHSLLYTRVW